MADIKIGALAGIPIKEREKCNTSNSNQYLDFDGKTLTLCENQKPTRTWGAISGSVDYQFKNMQHIADKGPLAEGVYQAKQIDLQHFQIYLFGITLQVQFLGLKWVVFQMEEVQLGDIIGFGYPLIPITKCIKEKTFLYMAVGDLGPQVVLI